MNTKLAMAMIVTLTVAPMHAQTAAMQRRSAKDTIERFCRMDADGTQLTAEGWNEMGALLVHRNSWYPRHDIRVVRDYAVRGPDTQGNTANFIVDYEVWGQIDSSLRFVRLEGLVANRPTRQREYISAVRTDSIMSLEVTNIGMW